MLNRQVYRWSNVLFFLAMIAVNILAETLPLAGVNTRELSQRYFTMLTPAGYAFMIWSVIYILTGCTVIYLFRHQDVEQSFQRRFAFWFAASCLMNISWLILWHYEFLILSFLAMVLLLSSLVAIYRLTRGILHPTRGETWFVRLPFSLYLGWICTATLVNLQVVLEHAIPDLQVPSKIVAISLIIVGLLAVILLSTRNRDGVLPLPLAWGLIAIAVNHREIQSLFLTAIMSAAILVVLAIDLLIIRAGDRD